MPLLLNHVFDDRKMSDANIKVTASLLLLLTSPSLFAQEPSLHSILTTCREYYIGLGLGPETANFKQSAFFKGTPENVNVIDTNQFSAKKGAFASLCAGLGFSFSICDLDSNRIYFGIEANADIRTLAHKAKNKELTHLNFNHTYYKMHRDFGIGLLPGILFSNSGLFYARLGYANGRFQSDTTDTSLQNISRSRNGFRYGLGFRQSLNECLAFRLEYGQINYKKIKMFSFEPIGNATKTTHITPRVQRFELGLLFNF